MQTQVNVASPRHRVVVERFVEACRDDGRVLAATLYGSNARGAADEHSDLDLGLITTDEAFAEFMAGHEEFMRKLGEPLFLESFDSDTTIFYIFADGVEGELSAGSRSRFAHIHDRAYQVLLDKDDLLAGAVFGERQPSLAKQRETLRQLIYWFWHDFSHFVTALARGQRWWAQGQIEVLRLICVNLARLRHNFADPYVAGADYFKVDLMLPVESLSPLIASYASPEPHATAEAARVLLAFYREVAPPLAQAHGIPYPHSLERLMVQRLESITHIG